MKRKTLGLLVAGILAAGSLGGTVAVAATGHEHSHAGAAQELQLEAGRKWATDEPLRLGMNTIRDAVDARLPAIHRGEMSAAQFDELGGLIDAQVAGIVQNCKLEPAADEALHTVLASLMEGKEAMQGRVAGAERAGGALQIVRSLQQYGEFFEHPGFAAPDAQH